MFILNTDTIKAVTKADRIMYYVGLTCMGITAFCLGWNSHIFEKDK